MRNVNKVILIGNVSNMPRMKDTGGGQGVTTFGVATHRYFTTRLGENKSVTEFHNIVTWGTLAKRCNEILRKGKLVYIEGYLKTRAFELEDGKKSFRTEIVAFNMIVLSKREAAEMTENGPAEDNTNYESEEAPAIEEVLDDNTF